MEAQLRPVTGRAGLRRGPWRCVHSCARQSSGSVGQLRSAVVRPACGGAAASTETAGRSLPAASSHQRGDHAGPETIVQIYIIHSNQGEYAAHSAAAVGARSVTGCYATAVRQAAGRFAHDAELNRASSIRLSSMQVVYITMIHDVGVPRLCALPVLCRSCLLNVCLLSNRKISVRYKSPLRFGTRCTALSVSVYARALLSGATRCRTKSTMQKMARHERPMARLRFPPLRLPTFTPLCSVY